MPSNRAFTLLELLVVITIIGILTSIVVVSMSGSTDSATIAKGKSYAQQVHALLGANAVGVWNFDEGTGTTVKDISGYGNNGILQGNAHFVDSEIEGYALSFDGTGDYVECGNDSSLNIIDEITISAWVEFNYLDYTSGTGKIQSIAGKGYPDSVNPNYGWWFCYDNRSNSRNFTYTAFGNSVGGWAGGGNNFGGTAYYYTFSTGIWYHITITVTETVAKLYIDGIQHGPTKSISNLQLSDVSRTLRIARLSTAADYFNGLIDEVHIYSEALPATEIQKHYVQGLNKLLDNQAITKAEYDQRMTEFNQSLVQNRF